MLALHYVELHYQKAYIDVAIQQHIMATASENSVDQFAGFIMGTNIGLFIIPSVISISYPPFSASTTQSG
jgi:hypothetical protein